MLDNKNRYIVLDFETTGLDHEKDDVIQIGLVEFDANFKIVNYYSSYIDPGYDIEKLKNIVSYTTGISIEQIKSGKKIEEVIKDISHFFGKNTVIVGQNIGFDIKFLQKYSSLSYKYSLDTLGYSKTLFHYLPSYSLDVVWDHLQSKYISSDDIKRLLTVFGQTQLSNHDALSDCIITYLLFYTCIKKIFLLSDKFVLLPYIIKHSEGEMLEVLDQDRLNAENNIDISLIQKDISTYLPAIMPYQFDSNPIGYEDNQDRVDRERYYYGDIPMTSFIRLFLNKKLIVSTHQKQKLNIIKSVLHNYGVKNITYAKNRNGLDIYKLLNILKQPVYSSFETMFFIKYFSHIDQGLSIMDLNQAGDYKIFNYARIEKPENTNDIVLTTHSGLYKLISEDQYKDHHIVYLDYERWSASYLKYLSTGYDPSNLPKIIDNFIYKYHLEKQGNIHDKLVDLMHRVDVFVGVLSMDIKNFLPNLSPNKYGYLELGVIENHSYFSKTNYLFTELTFAFQKFYNSYQDSSAISSDLIKDIEILVNQFDKLSSYMHSIVSIIVKDYNGYTSYELVQSQNYVDYSEFINIFQGYNISLFSNTNDNFKYIGGADPMTSSEEVDIDSDIDDIPIIETLDEFAKLGSYDKVFVLNNNQNHAKKIFDRWVDHQSEYDHRLFVENVTGSKGKNLYLSKSSDKMIVVGSYESLFMYKIEGIKFDKICTFGQLGALHKAICADVRYRIIG